ncbi:permease-like cell division protein FtsX [Amycolatopsis sp., V23-08]|uniref:Permease-like cell division protein FtsX n=1 Tax=Amycolatopsis heterodermiae TaxID=3110235 RepID=A0ABU5RKB2_9PSEU|nr:permease-like cell division protein FtsX [Amycolatopsis sp., V23-08]MEA5366009.1 permease-like cell division protein FtsX [Amycolatopsis sp., V23-08]
MAENPRSLVRIVVPVVVVALAAGVGLAFFVATLLRPPDLPVDTNPVPLAGHNLCASVAVYFRSDDEMRAAAETFHGDPKARRVFVQTKAEAYARFKEIFKDQAELLQATRPDDLPASVSLLAVPGTDLDAWARELHARFTHADQVRVSDLNATAAQLKLTAPPPKCPREGEY